MQKYFFFVPLVTLAFLTASCKKDKVSAVVIDPLCTDTISFSQKIQPLINQNCSTSGCHDASTQASGYNLTNHANIAANANIILSAMRSESGVTPMPLGGPVLPDSLIQQFSCWNQQGKMNN